LDLSNDISELKSLVLDLLGRVAELEKEIEHVPELKRENKELKRENKELKQENKELKSRLNQNSKNSHRPPSSDYKKNKTKPAIPRKKGKKKGGQKGHLGKTLEKRDKADNYVTLLPEQCCCGASLSGITMEEHEIRQVFDIPEPKLEVTQYTAMGCSCPDCGKDVSADFPAGVNSRVQYGDRVKALTVVLLNSCNLSYSRLNESTQFSVQQKCHDLLAPGERIIKEKLMQSRVNHFDETGLRVEGRNYWLHNCSNALYTYLFVHKNRGNKAIGGQESILPEYDGIAVHDCWRTYFLHNNADHALCNAHIIRELTAVSETGGVWAKRMADLLLYAYYKSKDGTSVVKDFSFISKQYDRICKMADQQEPPPIKNKGAKHKQSKGRNLFDRLVKHKHLILAFAKNELVPFTNNQAERDIRPAKTKIKVSGCFRTFYGAQRYARILAFISTTRKHQLNVFNEILQTFKQQQNFLTFTPSK